MKARGLDFVPVTGPQHGLALLLRREVEAIVYEASTLADCAERYGGGRLQRVGPTFHPERYAVAVPLDSPLRKRVNAALLEMMENGTYDELRRRWFPRP